MKLKNASKLSTVTQEIFAIKKMCRRLFRGKRNHNIILIVFEQKKQRWNGDTIKVVL